MVHLRRSTFDGHNFVEQVLPKTFQAKPIPQSNDLEFDDDEAEDDKTSVELRSTESMRFIRIPKAGKYSIDRAGESRIRTGFAQVVPCPKATFIPKDSASSTVCEGGKTDISVSIFGVPPLSLVYHSQIQGHREDFLVEGVQGIAEKV